MILETFRERAIADRLAEQALADADRLIGATCNGGRVGYRGAARRSHEVRRRFRLAIWLHNSLRISDLLAQLIVEHVELVVSRIWLEFPGGALRTCE